MARLARVEFVAADEVAVVDVMNRVVRRCFLLGDDAVTGKNFDHRKQWIEDELQKLAGAMGIDLLGCSWWMRLLCQTIAMRANREDGETGKFWQSRDRAVRLMDEESLLACAAYVDLNPIRAALAETLEASDHTSAPRRIEAERARAGSASDAEKRSLPTDDRQTAEAPTRISSPAPDRFLSPLELDEPGGELGLCVHRSGTRCSDKGFVPISLSAYLELLDWTARQTVPGKRGSTPSEAPPILERLKVSATTWCELVSNFGRLFSTVAGDPRIVDSTRRRRGYRRFHLTSRVRELLPMDP